MNILVTGGAGYIGSATAEGLLKTGHTVTVYDSLVTGHRKAVPQGATLVEAALEDRQTLSRTLTRGGFDAVMHFAAFIEVGESVQMPLKYYANNTCNTQVLLTAMEAAGVRKFVFSSTAAVYGMPARVPITEDVAKQPINPYGESKLAVERMCHYQSRTGKLRYAALRYFNACGAGHNGTLGEDHRPESHLIPLAIQAALGKRTHVSIFGADYDTPDGTCIRDYIHIDDLCQAHLLALNKLDATAELAYNLGNGQGYSVRQVIDTVREISGKEFKVVDAPRRPGDPAVLTSDATRARNELGWVTRKSQLRDMVATAWAWHRDHPNGYQD